MISIASIALLHLPTNFKKGVVAGHYNLGNYYRLTNDYQKSYSSFLNGLDLSREIKHIPYESAILVGISETFVASEENKLNKEFTPLESVGLTLKDVEKIKYAKTIVEPYLLENSVPVGLRLNFFTATLAGMSFPEVHKNYDYDPSEMTKKELNNPIYETGHKLRLLFFFIQYKFSTNKFEEAFSLTDSVFISSKDIPQKSVFYYTFKVYQIFLSWKNKHYSISDSLINKIKN